MICKISRFITERCSCRDTRLTSLKMETPPGTPPKISVPPSMKEVCENVRNMCLSWEKSKLKNLNSLPVEELQTNKYLLLLLNQSWRRICSYFIVNEIDFVQLESISRANLPGIIPFYFLNN